MVVMHSALNVHPEVAAALAEGRPVVALESTIISHGLPRPANLETALRIEEAVRAAGAVPATIAVVDGRVCVGLDEARLDAVAMRDDVVKVSRARRRDARRARRHRCHHRRQHQPRRARSPASTSSPPAASAASTARPATPGTSRPTSPPSASRPITVVCAGVKSILDVAGDPRAARDPQRRRRGLRHRHASPASTSATPATPLDWRVDSPSEVADVMAARRAPQPRVGPRRRQPAARRRGARPRAARPGPRRRARGGRAGRAYAARTSRRSCSTTSTARPHGASLEANVRIVLAQRRARRPGRRRRRRGMRRRARSSRERPDLRRASATS